MRDIHEGLISVEYMKFWHSGGALPVAPGVAFHLAQPLHKSVDLTHVSHDQSKSL